MRVIPSISELLFGLLVLLPFTVCSQNWEPDFDEALVKAAEQDKHMLLVFSGSDWCAPCIKLNRTIWQSEEFKRYANQKFVLYKADFPRKKKNKLPLSVSGKNKELAAKYNSKGFFPLVLVLDKDSKILGTTGYQKVSPTKYIQLLDGFLK